MSLLEEVYPPPWRMSLEEAHRRVSLHKADPQEDTPWKVSPPRRCPQDIPSRWRLGLQSHQRLLWTAVYFHDPPDLGRNHSWGSRMGSPVSLHSRFTTGQFASRRPESLSGVAASPELCPLSHLLSGTRKHRGCMHLEGGRARRAKQQDAETTGGRPEAVQHK